MAKFSVATKIMMVMYFFLSGVEYAVIIPTINGFILSLHASQAFLGVIMASFSFTGILTSPVFGRISDKLHSAKWCIVAANGFEIVGNFLYFTSSNFYLVWVARLIAGFGGGGASCVFGVVSKRTSEKERTSVFSLLMSSRQIGLIIGPGFSLFLGKLHFHIGPWIVDQYTAPGLLMAILWLLHTALWICFYNDKIQILPTDEEITQNENLNNKPRFNSMSNSPYIAKDLGTSEDTSTRSIRSLSMREIDDIKVILKSFVREEVVVCLASTFLIMFAQTGLETAITPITQIYFGWGGFQNSIFFCICGATIIISFLCLGLVSRRVSDRYLLASGTAALLGVYVMFFVYIEVLYHQPMLDPPWLLPVFVINGILLTIAIPFAWVPQASLFSKVTKKETQGFNQGFRLLFMGLGQIMGPLWASSLVDRLPLMVGVDLGLVVIVLVMILLSFNRLVGIDENQATSDTISNENIPYDSSDEEEPLLNREHTINA